MVLYLVCSGNWNSKSKFLAGVIFERWLYLTSNFPLDFRLGDICTLGSVTGVLKCNQERVLQTVQKLKLCTHLTRPNSLNISTVRDFNNFSY